MTDAGPKYVLVEATEIEALRVMVDDQTALIDELTTALDNRHPGTITPIRHLQSVPDPQGT